MWLLSDNHLYNILGGFMNFSNRESWILKNIQFYNGSVNDLSKLCNVSTKTIRNDIRSINNKIREYNSNIEIEDNYIKFNSIYPTTHWLNIVKLNQSISLEDLIFLKLLIKNEYITMCDFANEVYTSKSKIEKLIATSPNLNRYVRGKRNVGIKICVSGDERIRLMISTLLPYVDDLNYLVTTRALVQQIIDNEIIIKNFNVCISIFNKYVNDIESITDNECKILILIIILCQEVFEYDSETLDKIIHSNINTEVASNKVITIVDTTTKQVLNAHNIHSFNNKLYDGLINHLVFSISLRYPNTIEVEMELRLRTLYSYAYTVAREIYNSLCICLNVNIASYEINYIAMYVQSLIDTNRQSMKFKLLIVCQYGLSVSHYIQTWIEKNTDIHLDISISSVLDFCNFNTNLNDIDLIVTTVDNLEVDMKKLIKVDTIPLDTQLSLVVRKITNINLQKQINEFFMNNTIKQIEITTIDEIYNFIVRDFQYANPKFIKALKERTDAGLSNINGVIIMHSDGSLLNENKFLIYKLNSPILLNDEQVKMIFVFAFSTKFIELFGSVIKQIYRVIYSEHYINALYETASDKQFMWIFKNQIKVNATHEHE